MAHREIIRFRADINGLRLRPGRTAIFADGISALFRKCVFMADVVAVGGIELALVPGQTHAVQPAITVNLGFPLFDHVELHVLENTSFSHLGHVDGIVPQFDSFQARDLGRIVR